VPTGFSYLWLNNFSIFRRFTVKPECIEVTISEDGNICAFAAGYMLYGDSNNRKLNFSMKLPHYGLGVGRGMLSNSLLKINDKQVFFSEYFRNEERTRVHVYSSNDFGKTWEIAYEFKPGVIRHIHALHKDPHTGNTWICTGDNDYECMIGQSDNNYHTIEFIGVGSQVWRTCHLVFTEDSIYWGTDTGSEDISGIYRLDKKDRRLTKLLKVDGAVFFGTRLEKGTILLSTDREGFPNEKDDRIRLYVITGNEQITELEFGTWKHKKTGFRFNFAKLRFQRNQGSDFLAISVLNQKEVPDGDLILISEDELNRIAPNNE